MIDEMKKFSSLKSLHEMLQSVNLAGSSGLGALASTCQNARRNGRLSRKNCLKWVFIRQEGCLECILSQTSHVFDCTTLASLTHLGHMQTTLCLPRSLSASYFTELSDTPHRLLLGQNIKPLKGKVLTLLPALSIIHPLSIHLAITDGDILSFHYTCKQHTFHVARINQTNFQAERRQVPSAPENFDKILSGEIKGKELIKLNQQAFDDYNTSALETCTNCGRSAIQICLK